MTELQIEREEGWSQDENDLQLLAKLYFVAAGFAGFLAVSAII